MSVRISWYCYAGLPAGVTGVTISYTASTYFEASLMETSGQSCAVDVQDPTGGAAGAATSWNTGTMITLNANDLVLGFVYIENAYSVAATGPYTIFAAGTTANRGWGVAYNNVSSAGAYQPAGTMATAAPRALGIAYRASASLPAFTYQRQVTLGGSSLIPGSQSNFTVLVCANAPSGVCNTSVSGLNQSGAGAHVVNASGYDIAFSSTACSSPAFMQWEMEKYVAATGEMEAWVLINSLAANGTFYMCYGASGVSVSQGGSPGSAWDSNYQGIWHLGTLTSDSSVNNNSLSNTSVASSTGQIAGDGVWGGATAALTNTYPNNTPNHYPVTVELWVNPTTLATAQAQYLFSFSKYGAGSYQSLLSLAIANGSACSAAAGKLYYFENNACQVSTSAISAGVWTNLAIVFNSATATTLYINGSASTIQQPAGSPSFGPAEIYLGSLDSASLGVTGALDEVRVSNNVRSANWIKTAYNNQNSPSTFESFGSEASVGAAPSVVRHRIIQ